MNMTRMSFSDIKQPIWVRKKPMSDHSMVPYHWHENHYELEFVISGKANYVINDVFFEAEENMAFFATPMDFHSCSHDLSNPMMMYSVVFTEENIPVEYQNILFNTKIKRVKFENPEKIIAAFELLLSEVNNSDHFKSDIEKALLRIIVAEYIRNIDLSEQSVSSTLAQDIMKYIRIHISESLTLEGVAASFHISPQYLSRIFKQNMGVGFKKYITELRLKSAIKFISHTDLSITDICYKVGFENAGTFFRQFKENFGVSPTQYRNLHKK